MLKHRFRKTENSLNYLFSPNFQAKLKKKTNQNYSLLRSLRDPRAIKIATLILTTYRREQKVYRS